MQCLFAQSLGVLGIARDDIVEHQWVDNGPGFCAVMLETAAQVLALKAALRRVTDDVTAVVAVSDDGGSSGRLRAEFDVVPPGDLRMALAALCSESEWGQTWRDVLQHRFAGDGPLGVTPLWKWLMIGAIAS